MLSSYNNFFFGRCECKQTHRKMLKNISNGMIHWHNEFHPLFFVSFFAFSLFFSFKILPSCIFKIHVLGFALVTVFRPILFIYIRRFFSMVYLCVCVRLVFFCRYLATCCGNLYQSGINNS